MKGDDLLGLVVTNIAGPQSGIISANPCDP